MRFIYSKTGFKIFALCLCGMMQFLPSTVIAGDQPEKVPAHEVRQTAKIDPQLRAEFLAAMKFIKSEEFDKAIEMLNKVIAQSANNPVPYINLALVYKKTGNLKLAEENLKLAIKIDPENPVANNENALLHRQTGRFPEARRIYESILEKHPDFIMAHKNLGILCDLYMRDYKCALEHYTIYSGAVPEDGTVKIWIADLQGRH